MQTTEVSLTVAMLRVQWFSPSQRKPITAKEVFTSQKVSATEMKTCRYTTDNDACCDRTVCFPIALSPRVATYYDQYIFFPLVNF